ncbi:MFS transporter [Streptomyces sp. NBC_01498]|uniref:MFS transporter n=1 Tax=Streptomyces sp. NBC_01498 TaxID=2975870 RepID=UPI002E7AC169|nr:MFS transporter [Streptomyces sp. NBC_01498]WTL25023.1 MFS transporter [Streptomyces sp. NBC_01498]
MTTSTSPSAPARRRRLPDPRAWRVLGGAQLALLVGGSLINIGTFAVYPYLAVLLRERLGVGIAQVGVILGAATLVQFAGAPFTAAFAERVGLKRSLVLAGCLYTLGALMYLGGMGEPALMVVALFLSCGAGALYSPAYRAYLVRSATVEQRPQAVSAGNAAGNLGIALGPVAGALFLRDPETLFTLSTALYAVLTVGHLFLRTERPERTESPEGPEGPAEVGPPTVEPFRRVLHGLARVPFAVTALTHYLYMQFYQYLAVYVDGRLAPAAYGAIMMGYSLGLAVVQPLAARRVGRTSHPAVMAIGFSLMAVGMTAFATGHPAGVAVGAAAMSAGTAVLFLKNELEALALSKRSATVTFGQQRLAVGVGALLSGVVGGAVYGVFERAEWLPGFWLVVAAQCVLLPPLVFVAGRPRARTKANPTGAV